MCRIDYVRVWVCVFKRLPSPAATWRVRGRSVPRPSFGGGRSSSPVSSSSLSVVVCRPRTFAVFVDARHGGGAGRVLRADRGQAGARRADTRVQAHHAPRVRGHRGGRPVWPVVRPGPATRVRGCRGRGRGVPRPRGSRQRGRVPAGQAARHAARDGPSGRGRRRRARARGRPAHRHLHVTTRTPQRRILRSVSHVVSVRRRCVAAGRALCTAPRRRRIHVCSLQWSSNGSPEPRKPPTSHVFFLISFSTSRPKKNVFVTNT